MFVFDASSLIHAWDNYPSDQFPGLWKWMAGQFEEQAFSISRVACDEVKKKIPEAGAWLRDLDIIPLPLTPSALLEAQQIKSALGIVEERYHSKGVGENDLYIVAIAKLNGATLVTDEAMQTRDPDNTAKRKIPRVCMMEEVDVPTCSFIKLIKQNGAVFR